MSFGNHTALWFCSGKHRRPSLACSATHASPHSPSDDVCPGSVPQCYLVEREVLELKCTTALFFNYHQLQKEYSKNTSHPHSARSHMIHGGHGIDQCSAPTADGGKERGRDDGRIRGDYFSSSFLPSFRILSRSLRSQLQMVLHQSRNSTLPCLHIESLCTKWYAKNS